MPSCALAVEVAHRYFHVQESFSPSSTPEQILQSRMPYKRNNESRRSIQSTPPIQWLRRAPRWGAARPMWKIWIFMRRSVQARTAMTSRVDVLGGVSVFVKLSRLLARAISSTNNPDKSASARWCRSLHDPNNSAVTTRNQVRECNDTNFVITWFMPQLDTRFGQVQ